MFASTTAYYEYRVTMRIVSTGLFRHIYIYML